MTYLVETVYGSRLFGTAIPTSDMDIKRVYLSNMEDLVFGRNSTHNTVVHHGDVKFEIEEHHISSFCRMLKQGQTITLSMLFTPPEFISQSSPAWEELQANRHRLVSKNLLPYIGYARSQAQKYSLKGERLDTLDKFIADVEMLLEMPLIEGRLPTHAFEGLREHYAESPGVRLWTEQTANQTIDHIEICGKSFGATTPLKLWLDPLVRLRSKFGKRSEQAREDNGVDLKAMYHAVRLVGELNEILRTGHLTYPRPEAPLLLDIRNGLLTNGEVADLIDRGMQESNRLMLTSTLRDDPDEAWLDSWMLRTQAAHAVSTWSKE